ncbi:MAG TPA: hypothetical protein VGI30_13025 [Caulobacteraceae bacterium]|jgi:hypothetical protein
MATFNIEDAAFTGVGLLVRRPAAAITWALVWAILVAIVAMPFAGTLSAYVTVAVRTEGRPATSDILALAPQLGAFFLLMGLGGLVVGAVISCAVYRAVLEPESSEFAYLRLGDQEIKVMVVNFIRGLILFGINFTLSITLALFLVLANGAGPATTGLVRLVGEAVVVCVLFWVQLRLSLAGPMTYRERRFRLFESWTLTRGLTWRLVAVGVILFVIGVVVYLGVVSLAIAGSLAIWNSAPRPADLQALLSQPPAQWIGALAPFIALIGLMVLIAGALLTPIGLAPWPHIYRALENDHATPKTVT